MTTVYRPPADPADPEGAALDLIVEAAETATGSTAFRAVLQDLAGLLQVEGALAGLAWPDARLVAAAIAFDTVNSPRPARSLRTRADCVLDSWPATVDRAAIARALRAAADLVSTL
ncbi:amino acid aminotransferase [Mycobacterium intracellulare]|uniref:amino acid aminotransferase n=1 Tax=Mycobacterium intracellulare TaxID=1767 RepID=UPI003977D03D